MDFLEEKLRIEQAWEIYDTLSLEEKGELKRSVERLWDALDQGHLKVVEFINGTWHVHVWVKMAILLIFRLNEMSLMEGGFTAFDKLPLKFSTWTEADFKASGIRVVPGSLVRRGAFVASRTTLMPSFINIGAQVGEGTLIDTWATVGSCAHVGKNCHISGGSGLGGVLEPPQASPVIIEDNCFIGARSEVVEGVIVETGSVIGMGVFIGATTPIVNRVTGDITFGRVPPYSVVLAGSLPGKPLQDGSPGPHLNCAVIVKQVDEKTRAKTALNELLRV